LAQQGLTGALAARTLLLAFALDVEGDSGADEILERRLVDFVAFVDVDGAADIAVEARVEEPGRVYEGSAFRKGQLDVILVRLPGADDAGVRKDGRARIGRFGPLPLFDDFWVGRVDEGADFGEDLAAPVGEVFDLLVDGGGCGWSRVLSLGRSRVRS
jgi:hypothetical protein